METQHIDEPIDYVDREREFSLVVPAGWRIDESGQEGVCVILLAPIRQSFQVNGTLLDNCMIAYGSALSDGNRHTHHDLPVLVAGKAGGTLRTGRHIRFRRETPLNNLWLAMLERFGARTTSLGDSTGILQGLS